MHMNHFCRQYYKIKATAGLSSTSMWKSEKETETLPANQNHNGTIITDSTDKANILNSYYAFVFCCYRNIPKIELVNSSQTFIINTKIIRKISQNLVKKSVGPDGACGEILKLGGEAMTPFLARLLDILNNTIIPNDWKKGVIDRQSQTIDP